MGFDQTVDLYATIVQTLRTRFYNVVAALHRKYKTARRPAKTCKWPEFSCVTGASQFAGMHRRV